MPEKLENDNTSASASKSQSWSNISQEVTAESIKQFVSKNMDRLDKNQNGFISWPELFRFEKTAMSERDRVVFHKLASNYSNIARADGAYSDYTAQVSLASTYRYAEENAKLTEESSKLQAALDYGQKNFGALDKDKDGYISISELIKVAQRPESEPLISHFNNIKDASNDEWGSEKSGLSMKDLQKYHQEWKSEPYLIHKTGCGCSMCMGVYGGYKLKRGDFLLDGK